MKITVTKDHLQKALAVPWDNATCLIAQAVKELVGDNLNYVSPVCVSMKNGDRFSLDARARHLLHSFDSIIIDGYGSVSSLESELPCECEFKEI